MSMSPLIDELVAAFRCLPGVGQKSALRMALYLLERDREGGTKLSGALSRAMVDVKRCQQCQTFTEAELCGICASDRRDPKTVCVVETPSDLQAIEQMGLYEGTYFVLMGHLSPLEGIGPEEIGIDRFCKLIDKNECTEVILATNPTVEGEATAHFIADMVKSRNVLLTRLAHGIPVGGELGYSDGSTISHAFQGRRPFA
ncbi:recombination protein RecR [Oleiphilus messinensis]|uniref:Recombination protein RecR n=1 Tax=Oleiphilus messinensis TaxID=141451 RepID=A0A1Y0IAW3_9GAMM|nr:recombination mediator RecR [Oleiphilus messinensis]ARU57390.1 recombination protein RecR [Oleiphilus messinensis]